MRLPAQQDPALVWGQLSFINPDAESEGDFEIEALASGTSLGNPGPIIETMPSLLLAGELATRTGWENREIAIKLRISANDGNALARAEAALFAQQLLDQPPPLEWTPMIKGATNVFDVVVANLSLDNDEDWDWAESYEGYRYYLLTLTCLPFARSADSTIVPALPLPADPVTAVFTNVDTCGSTAGWTLETDGGSPTGPTAVAGPPSYVGATAVINSPGDHLRLVRTGAIVVPANYYLAVDVEGANGGTLQPGWSAGSWRARLDGVYVDPIAITYDGENNSARLFFADVGTIAELAILKDFSTGKGATSGTTPIRVYNVATTDTLGSSTTTTNRQQSRLVTVTGSAPTTAALRLYDATPADLAAASGTKGNVLVYTSRNVDWRPNLRRWISSSAAPTTDATLVSGARHTLTTPTKYLVPPLQLTPGSYALMARMSVSVAGTLTWQARMATAGGATNTVGSNVIVTGTVELAVTTGYDMFNLAALVLPVVEVEGSNYAIEITLTGTANMTIDEAWLFSLDDGVLTWVADDEGIDWLEIRSPELGAARPSVWGGRNAVTTGASCIDWKTLSFGPHRFDPGQMQIFTVTPASLIAQCEIEFFPRFHSNVMGEETS